MTTDPSPQAAPEEEDLVFNLVYVPSTFRILHTFLVSMLETSRVRARIVANGCPDRDLEGMQTVADLYPGRIEILPLPPSERLEHGEALDALYERVDSDYFCFLDTDVMARGPWVEPFLETMRTAAAVSSAHPSWDPDPRAPAGETGLRGHFVYGSDGRLFGSSYLAIYRRDAVDDVRARWQVGFQRATIASLPSHTREHLAGIGGPYSFLDTAKIINSLLQLDGYGVAYLADTPLLHIGAMSILEYMTGRPWQKWPDPGNAARVPDKCARDTVEVAANVAALLMELFDGERPGRVPPFTDPVLSAWLTTHEPDFRDLVERYRRLP